jgi:hypothetical protein
MVTSERDRAHLEARASELTQGHGAGLLGGMCHTTTGLGEGYAEHPCSSRFEESTAIYVFRLRGRLL